MFQSTCSGRRVCEEIPKGQPLVASFSGMALAAGAGVMANHFSASTLVAKPLSFSHAPLPGCFPASGCGQILVGVQREMETDKAVAQSVAAGGDFERVAECPEIIVEHAKAFVPQSPELARYGSIHAAKAGQMVTRRREQVLLLAFEISRWPGTWKTSSHVSRTASCRRTPARAHRAITGSRALKSASLLGRFQQQAQLLGRVKTDFLGVHLFACQGVGFKKPVIRRQSSLRFFDAV